jgi:hypothetical protein
LKLPAAAGKIVIASRLSSKNAAVKKLLMWKHYFDERCKVHGVDIQPECKAYENSHTTIHIADQVDQSCWKRFREDVAVVDILIDDGSHVPEHQMVTLEEILPHVRPGGVFLCEDLAPTGNQFNMFAYGIADELHARVRKWQFDATPFQAEVHSVHFYPYVVVIEKRDSPLERLSSPRHGTQWQPHLG